MLMPVCKQAHLLTPIAIASEVFNMAGCARSVVMFNFKHGVCQNLEVAVLSNFHSTETYTYKVSLTHCVPPHYHPTLIMHNYVTSATAVFATTGAALLYV